MFYIKNVKMNHFRCYSSAYFEFSNTKNIIIGDNGVGKTTLVEAICYLCLGKSFKNIRDNEILQIDSPYFNVIGEIEDSDKAFLSKIVIGYDKKNKKISNNGVFYKTLSEYVGKYKVISFSPDDLDLIKGAPSIRRRLIDIYLCQKEYIYTKTLSEYKHLLKQRNELLRNKNVDMKYLSIVTNALIEKAIYIINKRNEFIAELDNFVQNKAKALTNNAENVHIEYKPNCNITEIKEKFQNDEQLDILTQSTNNGPHRDDILIYVNDKKANIYSSQGQIRTAVLSIKLSIIDYFKTIDDNIIIILDDVFSELDNFRQIKLIENIGNDSQVFITSTNVDNIPENIIKESKIIRIGAVK